MAQHIDTNSRLYIEPMDGFKEYLAAAIIKKKVPVLLTDNKESADFIISGIYYYEKAGWAKTIFNSPLPAAGASISVKNPKSGEIVFAYTVDRLSANRGNQSTAEACAKHLKQAIEKK